MFNKELKNEIKRLRERMSELTELVNPLYVANYFSGCPCCGGAKKLLKSEAKEFSVLSYWAFAEDRVYPEKKYTTPEGYKNHLPAIEKWAEDVKQLNRQPK